MHSTDFRSEDPRTNPSIHDQIARRAHELWEQEGRRHGSHERHWLEAEHQLLGIPAGGQDSLAHPEPDGHGNPAYPSLAARTSMIAENTGKHEPVKMIPADALARPRP